MKSKEEIAWRARTRKWLAQSAIDVANDEEQKKLHAVVDRLIGSITSGKPRQSRKVRETVSKNLPAKSRRSPRE